MSPVCDQHCCAMPPRALERHCASCHNPDFSGREHMPRLVTQREDCLLKPMRDYKSGARIDYGDAAMSEVVAGLVIAELQDRAHLRAPGVK